MTNLQDVGLTVGGLATLVGIVVAAAKLWTIIGKRIDDGMMSALAKAGGVEIKADRAITDLAEFKIEVARTYVTHEASRRLEDRIDQGFATLRQDVGDLRSTLIDALSDRQGQRRRPPS